MNADDCSWHGVIGCTLTEYGEEGPEPVYAVSQVRLENNGLQGSIPADIGLLFFMEQFDIATNSVGGQLPPSLGEWRWIDRFEVGNNNINGEIPSSVGQWTSMDTFIAENNSLSGSLPSSIGQWTVLRYFDVQFNQLEGNIPSTVANWFNGGRSPTVVIVRFNLFTGVMPICSIDTIPLLQADREEIFCSCCTHCCPDPQSCNNGMGS